MNIVILDGYTLNPGDLSWQGLEKLGNVSIYERTPPDLVLERASGADILLTNKTPLHAEILAKLSDLQYIGVLATGYDVVDVNFAKQRNVVVTNVPGYGTDSVAQMVFALLLELCQNVKLHSDAVRSGEWAAGKDWCFWKTPLVELAGKTLGIVGYGQIGEQVARIGLAFGMKIVAFKRTMAESTPFPNFRWARLSELLEVSDVVSLHCPLTPETEGMINKASLAGMKSTAFLINTARGKLLVDEDLADALNRGVIAGAGLDVLSVEPPHGSNPLFKANNCIITPHIAWATKEARSRLLNTAVDNIRAFISGTMKNVVNK
ncbi:D-2-hydroxyacid dehydrogenase [Paenibacillus hamazuiensis]|uniref:D-2-hydroxyacid dehydrogenase n=1 Tax=Paenibacillus hamazuiensis TaxID=2936508 RepID=UPI00200D1DCC